VHYSGLFCDVSQNKITVWLMKWPLLRYYLGNIYIFLLIIAFHAFCVLFTNCHFVNCSPTAILCTVHKLPFCVLFTNCHFVNCSPTAILCTVHKLPFCVLFTNCHFVYCSPPAILCNFTCCHFVYCLAMSLFD
jgi:hypothetical protein